MIKQKNEEGNYIRKNDILSLGNFQKVLLVLI